MSEQISTAQLARELQTPSPDCHWSAAHRCVLRTRHRDMFAFGADPRLSPSLNCLLIKAYRDGKWPLTPEQVERGVLGIEDFLRANPPAVVRATLNEISRIGPIRGGQISQVLVSKTNVSLCKFICKDSKRAKVSKTIKPLASVRKPLSKLRK